MRWLLLLGSTTVYATHAGLAPKNLNMMILGSSLVMYCFICKMSLLYTALCAKRPSYVVLYMQNVLNI